MSTVGYSINNHALDANVNVYIRIIDKNKRILKQISKHNKATHNMTEGVIRFLRGEFNSTFLREFKDTINNIGDNSELARQFIPTHIGIGNVGIDTETGEIPEGLIKFNTIFEPSYSDTALRSEILPKYNQTRVKIGRSTKNDSILSDTYILSVQGYYQFNQIVKPDEGWEIEGQPNEDPFNFVYLSDKSDVTRFTKDGIKYITITEFGLFSGDVNDSGSRLLARLLLDPTTPLIVSENDTVIIDWQIGLESLNEFLLNRDSSHYKYQMSGSDSLSNDTTA